MRAFSRISSFFFPRPLVPDDAMFALRRASALYVKKLNRHGIPGSGTDALNLLGFM
jgi:hypothetical protein